MDPLARRWPPVIEIIDDDMAKIIRAKTGAERLAIADGMWNSTRQTILGYLRAEHPNWTDAQVQRETARRMSHGSV